MLVRIGITCNLAGLENRLSLPYVRAVARAGAVPLLLPVGVPHWQSFLECIDGLLLSGGGDPDARHYGEEAAPGQGNVQPARDRLEIGLAAAALRRRLPVLGICRGAQILCIAAGGTLYQDLAGVASLQHDQQAPRGYPIHAVQIAPGSLLYKIVGEETIRVNSFHHQAIRETGTIAKPAARSSDGVVEAVEVPGHPFALGVQWHPEWLAGRYRHARRLFTALAKASAYR